MFWICLWCYICYARILHIPEYHYICQYSWIYLKNILLHLQELEYAWDMANFMCALCRYIFLKYFFNLLYQFPNHSKIIAVKNKPLRKRSNNTEIAFILMWSYCYSLLHNVISNKRLLSNLIQFSTIITVLLIINFYNVIQVKYKLFI